jgi:ABC-type Mn2+/Zn2+ transport system permease subunit
MFGSVVRCMLFGRELTYRNTSFSSRAVTHGRSPGATIGFAIGQDWPSSVLL